MKFILYLLLALLVVVGLAYSAQQDPGYFMVTLHGWTIETSATFAIIVTLLAFVCVYALLRLIGMAIQLPLRVRRWRKLRAANSSRKQLIKGMIKLSLGQWFNAEKLLLKSARHDDLAVPAYMGAARAAQGLKAKNRRDGYLLLAGDKSPNNTLALALTQAQLEAEDGHPEESIATLNKLPLNHRNNSYALSQLARYHAELKDWPALVELLPRLRRHDALPLNQYYELEHQAYSGLIGQLTQKGNSVTLWQLWDELPTRLQEREDIVADFSCAMINFGYANDTEGLLYRHINKKWSEFLVYLYGLMDGDVDIHLSRAKNWLKSHQNSAVLHLTLGRLAVRAQQWKNARYYLETSLKLSANAETYQELGNLFNHINEPKLALECYRRGLALTENKFIKLEVKSGVVERPNLPRSGAETGTELVAEA